MSKWPNKETWSKLRPRAREFRRGATRAEELLWEELRNRRLGGLKFRRQHPIDRYLVDFYCAEARLVVEVDGIVHADNAEGDALRQLRLESLDLRVVRFSNEEIERDLASVLRRITTQAQSLDAAPPLHAVERGPGGEV